MATGGVIRRVSPSSCSSCTLRGRLFGFELLRDNGTCCGRVLSPPPRRCSALMVYHFNRLKYLLSRCEIRGVKSYLLPTMKRKLRTELPQRFYLSFPQ